MNDPTHLAGRAMIELADADDEELAPDTGSRDWHPALKAGVIVAGLAMLSLTVRLILEGIF